MGILLWDSDVKPGGLANSGVGSLAILNLAWGSRRIQGCAGTGDLNPASRSRGEPVASSVTQGVEYSGWALSGHKPLVIGTARCQTVSLLRARVGEPRHVE